MRVNSYQTTFRIEIDPNGKPPEEDTLDLWNNPISAIELGLKDAFPCKVEIVRITMEPQHVTVTELKPEEPNPAPAILAKPKRRIAP